METTHSLELRPDEHARYARQLVLAEVGLEGQQKLKSARVLIVGVGGLGSPVALYLAAAGIGVIGLADHDIVQVSNLHRQVIYSGKQLGVAKLDAAREALLALNSSVEVMLHSDRLTAQNAMEIIAGYDIIVDCSDNFATRYLVNDACVLAKKPCVYGSVYQFEGRASIFAASGGPCYRCLYPTVPGPELLPSCEDGGVLGVLPGIIGCIQATEVLKLILGIGNPLIGRLMMFDALAMTSNEVHFRRSPVCPVCGDSPTIMNLRDSDTLCNPLSTGSTTQAMDFALEGKRTISVEEYRDLRTAGFAHFLLDVREAWETQLATIGGTLIPLGALPDRFEEVPRNEPIVVMCHHGIRSSHAANFLRKQGFERVLNLEGGIAAWGERIDRTIGEY